MKIKTMIRTLTLIGVAVVVGLPGAAYATLVRDTVNFQCTNCGPPTNDTFVVLEGAPELNLFGQLQVDVEASSLRINWVFDSNFIIPDLNLVWSDLNSSLGDIVGVTVDPSSTWGVSPPVTVAFGLDSVSVTNNGDSTVIVGDFLLLNLDFSRAVPAPASLTLIALGLIAVGWARASRRKAGG